MQKFVALGFVALLCLTLSEAQLTWSGSWNSVKRSAGGADPCLSKYEPEINRIQNLAQAVEQELTECRLRKNPVLALLKKK